MFGTRSSQTPVTACSTLNSSPPRVSFPPLFFCAFPRGKHIDFQREEQQKQGDGTADTASNAAGPGSDKGQHREIVEGFWWRADGRWDGEEIVEELHPA